jgi:hypothetical protein
MNDIPQHPLEALFDIVPGSTFPAMDAVATEATKTPPAELIDPTTGEIIERKIDASAADIALEERLEDLKIDGQLDQVHGAAMTAFHHQHTMSQQVDPKFSARNAEVAAQYLSLALNSISTRADVKYKRNKLSIAKSMGSAPSTVNNNVIVADRNSLLKSLFKQDFETTMTDQLEKEIDPTRG